MASIIESIPNISEGRRADVVDGVAAALRGVPACGCSTSRETSDHNRSVLSLAGEPRRSSRRSWSCTSAPRPRSTCARTAASTRALGAVDVVPFVPIEGATHAGLRSAGARGGPGRRGAFRRASVPLRGGRQRAAPGNLEDIRRGQFEGLPQKLADPLWVPDFGPAQPHASAGASVIGARAALIAYNINLGTAGRRGGEADREGDPAFERRLPHVKALGLMLQQRTLAQVSINMTDYKKDAAASRVRDGARRGAPRQAWTVVGSESRRAWCRRRR
jgi:glutamate formiminotransferase